MVLYVDQKYDALPFIIPSTKCEDQLNWEDIIGSKNLSKDKWRFFIITCGAPGTGKSTSSENLKYYANNIIRQRDKKNWVSVSHDAYVETKKDYDNIIKKYNSIKTRAKKKRNKKFIRRYISKSKKR